MEKNTLFEYTINKLSILPEIKIKKYNSWKLQNYLDLEFGEILIKFNPAIDFCPQGPLYYDPNFQFPICGANNLYDLRNRLGIRHSNVDTSILFKHIFIASEDKKEIVIINLDSPLMIDLENPKEFMNYASLTKLINENSRIEKKYIHLSNYLRPL